MVIPRGMSWRRLRSSLASALNDDDDDADDDDGYDNTVCKSFRQTVTRAMVYELN